MAKKATPAKPEAGKAKSEATDQKSQRGIKWLWSHPDRLYGVIHITTEEGEWDYFLLARPGYYELNKLEPLRGITAIYRVTLKTPDSCMCQGFQTHKTCKHVLGLNSLREKGQL